MWLQNTVHGVGLSVRIRRVPTPQQSHLMKTHLGGLESGGSDTRVGRGARTGSLGRFTTGSDDAWSS